MIYRFPRIVRQLIALSLVLLVAIAVHLAAVGPVVEYISDLKGHIQQERQLLGRLQAALAETGQHASSDAAAPNLAELMLEGESDAVKQAAMQTKLAELVSSVGLKLIGARNLPQRDRGRARLVGLQLQLTGPIEALQQVLFTIEHQKPVFIVDALQISPSWTANEDEKGFLDARIDIFGAASIRAGS